PARSLDRSRQQVAALAPAGVCGGQPPHTPAVLRWAGEASLGVLQTGPRVAGIAGGRTAGVPERDNRNVLVRPRRGWALRRGGGLGHDPEGRRWARSWSRAVRGRDLDAHRTTD